MQIKTIFFDLDGTLYDNDNGVWQMVGARIDLFMKEHVGIEEKDIPRLRGEYLEKYGTTLRGLHTHFNVDAKEYLDYVHDVAIEEKISANRELEEMLMGLKQKKWIFTNASKQHAERVLAALGVGGYFRGIIDVRAMNYQNKPMLKAYTVALDEARAEEGKVCLFIDDRAENLPPAKELGAKCVLVGTKEPHPAADASILKIEELLEAMPSLVE